MGNVGLNKIAVGASVGGVIKENPIESILNQTAGDIRGNAIAEVGGSVYLYDYVKLYGLTAGDDVWYPGFARRVIPWGRNSAYLIGAYLGDLFRDGRADLRIELARLFQVVESRFLRRGISAPNGWYAHSGDVAGNFPYIYRDWIVGHHVGRGTEEQGFRNEERDAFFRTTYQIWNDIRVGFEYDRERAEALVPFSGDEGIDRMEEGLDYIGVDIKRRKEGDRFYLHLQGKVYKFSRRFEKGAGPKEDNTHQVWRLLIGFRLY